MYRLLRDDIIAVYNCAPPTNLATLSRIRASTPVPREKACPADVAVLVAKWLFAEQDLTYWNFSGRNMLFNYLDEEGLL